MSARLHADAILALLKAAPGTTPLVVHDGAVPDGGTPPYVLVYFADTDPEQPDSRSLAGPPQRFVLRIYAHCVGGNAAAARAVGDRVRTALLNVTPTVTGRACFPISREDSVPPERDESTGSLVMDRVDVYRLESEPA